MLRSGSGKTVSTVIIDSQNSDNEDDEQFVVEAAPQLSEIAEIEMVSSPEGLVLSNMFKNEDFSFSVYIDTVFLIFQ